MTEVLHIYAAVKSGRERAQTRHFCNLAYPGPGLEERFFSRNPSSQAGKNLNRNVSIYCYCLSLAGRNVKDILLLLKFKLNVLVNRNLVKTTA